MNLGEYDELVNKYYFDELGKKELRQLIRKMLYDREMYKWFRLNRIILD
jgi:hypothetical protein